MILPRQPESLSDFVDDVEVLSCDSWHIDDGSSHLYLSVCIGEGSEFFHECGRGQDDVGKAGGFCEEDVLYDEVIESGKSGTGMLGIGIGHGWIFAHDVESVDFAIIGLVDNFDDGESWIFVEVRGVPEFFHTFEIVLICDELVVREGHGDEAGVRCSLHIILSTQRMESCPWFSDVSGDEGESDKAACVLCAVCVLGDSHSPEDDGIFCASVGSGDFTYGFCIDSTFFGHSFWCVWLYGVF